MTRNFGVATFPGRRIALSAIVAVALGAPAAVNPAAAQSLISADFGTTTPPPPSLLFSGVEPRAVTLDPAFGAASVWNRLAGTNPNPPNPSFAALLDSTGSATSVSFSVTGNVGFFNFGGTAPTDALFRDYLFFNAAVTYSAQIDWRISGLIPNAVYQMVLYGASTDVARTFNMLVDTDGDGDLTDESPVAVVTLGSLATPAAGQLGYLPSITASASGAIIGRGVGTNPPSNPNEADWAGFQLAVVDSDGDGVPDGADACSNSDLSSTVVIDGCESGVANALDADGCTISDLVAECADGARNHGAFVSCVAHLTNDLQTDRVISGREKGAIQRCAARSDLP